MQVNEYEKGQLVAACWKLAQSNDVNELVAIACTIRNWVVKRFQARVLPMNGKVYFESYSEAVENFLQAYPTRSLPAINEPALIDPSEGLLMKIDGVYDCSLVDMTSSRANPFGARYFMRSALSSFQQSIRAEGESIHPLIGTFGSQQFYA